MFFILLLLTPVVIKAQIVGVYKLYSTKQRQLQDNISVLEHKLSKIDADEYPRKAKKTINKLCRLYKKVTTEYALSYQSDYNDALYSLVQYNKLSKERANSMSCAMAQIKISDPEYI